MPWPDGNNATPKRDAPSKWRTIVYAAIVSAVLLFGLMQSGLLVLFGNAFPIEGDVISVATRATAEREAVIRLNLGPVVKASIPSACLVFPGQVATLNFTGSLIGSEPAFRLWESRDRQ
jgi:hypothetical protein